MAPSTDWHENVLPTEERDFAAGTARLVAMQAERSKRYGAGRAVHRKQLLALRGTLEVLGGIPGYAAHGLFAQPGTYDGVIRLSNGSMDMASDKKPDIRGFALKVQGVEGPGTLGAPTTAQDFLLIDRPITGFTRPEEFFEVVLAASKSPLAVVWYLIRTLGFGAGLKRLTALQAGQARPFHGFASTTFYSAAPIAVGPYAARVRLVPVQPDAPATGDWAADVTSRLAKADVLYDLALQFFQNEAQTPIEDGAVDWPEAVAPYVTVARLTVPSQTPDHALAARVEAEKFDPWSALAAHRPLGAIMRARKVAYFGSQSGRGANR